MNALSLALGAVGGFLLAKFMGPGGASSRDLNELAMAKVAAAEDQLAIAEARNRSSRDRQEAAEIAVAFASHGVNAAERARSPRIAQRGRDYLQRAYAVMDELASD